MEVMQVAGNGKVADDGNEEEQWSDVFWMLQEGGQGDRGAHYALTIASLKRKGEDIQQQIDSLRSAEGNLLQAAHGECASSRAEAEPLQPRDAKQAKTWGQALAIAVFKQAREASEAALQDEPPFAPTKLALEAQQQVADTLEAHNKAQVEAQLLARAQQEQAMRQQQQQIAEAQALAEAQAMQLAEAQMQAEAMAEMQLALHAEAAQVLQQQEQFEQSAKEVHLLRAQGLNSKKLPLRPGVPPCGFFMRKGECKYGRQCKWDHPEVMMNSRGFPTRHGESPCAFYMRMGVCKFSSTCKYDHPENIHQAQIGLDMNAQLAQLQEAGYSDAGMEAAKIQEEQVQIQLQQLLGQGYGAADLEDLVNRLTAQGQAVPSDLAGLAALLGSAVQAPPADAIYNPEATWEQ